MNKKGFTLIELLAVIVILAIIALIATPIIMNVIESSKKGAAERSAENYLRGIETKIIEEKMETGKFISDGVYNLSELENKLGTIEVNGTKAENASILIKEGQVLDGSTLEINDYVVNIIDGAGKVGDFGVYKNSAQIKNQSSTTPTIKFNPKTNMTCTTIDDVDCFGWYVLEDKGEDYAYVTLLMNKNIGNTIDWGDAIDEKKPTVALPYLQSITSNWTVAVGMPTYEQIYAINGSTLFSNRTWLYGNLTEIPEDYTFNNPPYGYWTSTCVAALSYAVKVKELSQSSPDIPNMFGVRPVINVLKSKL